MKKSVIVDGARSPIGLKNGQMVGMRADDLSANIIKELLLRNPEIDKSLYEDVVLGCAFPEGSQGMLISKGVSILSEIYFNSSTFTVLSEPLPQSKYIILLPRY